MALVVMGVCETCGAQQLDNGMIMVNPEQAQRCQTHDFVKTERPLAQPKPPGPDPMPNRYELPTQAECKANDQLAEHQNKVEGKISATQNTIATLEASHEHWRQVIQDDFQRVMNAAENRRDILLDNLDELVQHKQTLLAGQLDEYQEHFSACQDMLDDIYRRIHLDERNAAREAGIKDDSRKTIQAFPKLEIIPIAVAAECQTQPMVESLNNFGAILESGLGRLPTVLIEEVDESRGEINFSVIDPEDAEEKIAVEFIPNLMIEVQASVFYDRSCGWDVSWTNRVSCEKAKDKMRIITKGLPNRETVGIRARTIIIHGDSEGDPLRISRWSDVTVMANKMKRLPGGGSNRLPVDPSPVDPNSGGGGGGGEAPPQPAKKIFVICVDPTTGNKLPCRPQPPDYLGAIRGAAIRKWKWSLSPEDIKLKIVSKDGGDLVSDLSEEMYPNNVLADMWDRNAHFVHVVQEAGGEAPPRVSSPVAVTDDVEVPNEEEIVWPKRLMVRIKQQPTRESPARPSPLKIEERDQPGGWLGALQRRYCERFSLPEEGEMNFYFVDDEGNRVKDIRRDADFLYVQENRKKVYAVGESA